MSASPGDGVPFEKVLQDENEVIQLQRRNRGYVPEEGDNRRQYGLAFSGGGIRSASFALGVLQCLARRDQLKKFDYLSTVSGGGYIGASLTWFHYLNRDASELLISIWCEELRAPRIRRRRRRGTRQYGIYSQSGRISLSSERVDQHLLETMLRGPASQHADHLQRVLPVGPGRNDPFASLRTAVCLEGKSVLAGLSSRAVFIGLRHRGRLLLLSVVYGFSSWFIPYFLPSSDWQYRWRVLSQRWLGWVLAWTVGLAIIGSIAPGSTSACRIGRSPVSVFATTGFSGLLFESPSNSGRVSPSSGPNSVT